MIHILPFLKVHNWQICAGQKVGRAMPRARAWLRPWRSAWTRAAAAGGVWGHEQMSFTTSTAGLLLFCRSASFQELPSSSQNLTCNLGTHRKRKKKQLKMNYKSMEMLFGLSHCLHGSGELFVSEWAVWHRKCFPTWGIHFASSLHLFNSVRSPPARHSSHSYWFRRQYRPLSEVNFRFKKKSWP